MVHTPQASACDNTLFCDGAETCDALLGCVNGTPPALDDLVSCTLDTCDEAHDLVVHTPQASACADPYACTSDVCDPKVGCQHPPVPEVLFGDPALYLDGINTCGTGTCSAVERLDDVGASLGCTAREPACTECSPNAQCISREYRNEVWRLCLVDAEHDEAQAACGALGMTLASPDAVGLVWLAETRLRLDPSASAPLRLDGAADAATAYSGFACSRPFEWLDYAQHGLYGPAWLGDWQTLGVGDPDLTDGSSRADAAVEWLDLVVTGSPTNQFFPARRADRTPIACDDPECPYQTDSHYGCDGDQCTFELQNSFWHGKVNGAVSGAPLNRLIIRGPLGHRSCADYPEDTECHEVELPALRIRWQVDNPNGAGSIGSEGTVLFRILHIPNVIIDGVMIEQLGGAELWQPLRAGDSTFSISDVDNLEIERTYVAGVVRNKHFTVSAIDFLNFHDNEISGLRLDRLTDRDGNRRFIDHHDVTCSGASASPCPEGVAECSCPMIGSGGFGLSNGNNKPRGPNSCDDPTVAVTNFDFRNCEVEVAGTVFDCRVCRLGGTACPAEGCAAGSACAPAFDRCYVDNGCEADLYSDQATYDAVMQACSDACDTDFLLVHSNSFRDFSFIEPNHAYVGPFGSAGNGVCTASNSTGTSCLVHADCGVDHWCDAGTCAASAIPASTCQLDADCSASAHCHDVLSVCVLDSSLGGTCGADAECPGFCDEAATQCSSALGDGQACSRTGQCAATAWCDPQTAECTVAIALESQCATDEQCGTAAFCDLSQAPSKCAADLTAGFVCERHEQCGDPLRCIQGVCSQGGTAGGFCAVDQACVRAAHCQATAQVCVADLGLGAACDDDESCAFETTHCDEAQGVCVSHLAKGATCAESSDCVTGTFCDAATCAAGYAAGLTCQDDHQCAAGLACAGGVCAKLGGVACTKDNQCASGYECEWPCPAWRSEVASRGLENAPLLSQAREISGELRCCYTSGTTTAEALAAPGFHIPGLANSFAQKNNKSVLSAWFIDAESGQCPAGAELPMSACIPPMYGPERGKCVDLHPNYDQVGVESPSDGILFNNDFRRIYLTDSAFDFGHRRSCDPSYHDKHFRVERNLVDHGRHKLIGMSHPSNGVTMVNNLMSGSPSFSYHSWWKQRFLHNTTIWRASDTPNPWSADPESRWLMKSWEVGEHPDSVPSCPNDVGLSPEALAAKSDVCTTNEHGYQYLNGLVRFQGDAAPTAGLNAFLWNYQPPPSTTTFNQSYDAIAYRGMLFAVNQPNYWIGGDYDPGVVPLRFAQDYCEFQAAYADGTVGFTQTLGVTLAPGELPIDAYEAARWFDPTDGINADPELTTWLANNRGAPITSEAVCEPNSVQCFQAATEYQAVATTRRDWYGRERSQASPTRGAFNVPAAPCVETNSCPANPEVTFCE